mmetsp:Transcript_53284/g.125013  ORF Transcript_53284/g.125013 Transcript_53284/m.125013 type:complete len:201 (+) Transcript_53284:147-749(+)
MVCSKEMGPTVAVGPRVARWRPSGLGALCPAARGQSLQCKLGAREALGGLLRDRGFALGRAEVEAIVRGQSHQGQALAVHSLGKESVVDPEPVGIVQPASLDRQLLRNGQACAGAVRRQRAFGAVADRAELEPAHAERAEVRAAAATLVELVIHGKSPRDAALLPHRVTAPAGGRKKASRERGLGWEQSVVRDDQWRAPP